LSRCLDDEIIDTHHNGMLKREWKVKLALTILSSKKTEKSNPKSLGGR